MHIHANPSSPTIQSTSLPLPMVGLNLHSPLIGSLRLQHQYINLLHSPLLQHTTLPPTSLQSPTKPPTFSLTMSTIFCCSSIQPFKPRILSHEPKFRTFMAWAAHPTSATVASDASDASGVTFAIQVVKQVNYGPLESKRYFVLRGEEFVEVDEKWLVDANFEKLNT
jgi:hypothetical protein